MEEWRNGGISIGESFAKCGAAVIALAKVGDFCQGAPTIRTGFTGGFEYGVVQKSSPFTHITHGFTHCVFRSSGSFATVPCHNAAFSARTANDAASAGRHGQRWRAPHSIATPV